METNKIKKKLSLALKNKEKSIKLYEIMIQESPDEQIKELLMKIKYDELEHRSKLVSAINNLGKV